MAEQLSFSGFEPPRTDRLFFAIQPDPRAAGRTEAIANALRDKCGLAGKPLTPKRLHVSLYHLGDYAGLPGDIIVKAGKAAAAVAEAPFGVAFDSALSFSRKRGKLPLVLGGGDSLMLLAGFHHALGEAMARNGLGRFVPSGFTPHMTLLYDSRYVAARQIEPVTWTVREFVLIHSLLGRTKYVPLARFPLRLRETRILQ
jgi:2'-5' RNA ligase